MSTAALIRDRVSELETFFKANSYAMPNEYALRKIRFLCTSLCVGDSYVAEKASEIWHLAGRFYSVRKHQTYRGGADGIFDKIANDLIGRIRTRADSIEFNERNP